MKAIGFKIKSGFAVAAVLTQDADAIKLDIVHRVALSTDALPQSRFPYHPTIELPEREGAVLSRRAVEEVRRIAASEVGKLLDEMSGIEHAGIVVGSTIDPDKLGNPHVRVHALEGKLFREVVVAALERRGIDCAVLVEREAYRAVAAEIKSTEACVRSEIAGMNRGAVKPWRADEKLATLAAWWRLGASARTRSAPSPAGRGLG